LDNTLALSSLVELCIAVVLLLVVLFLFGIKLHDKLVNDLDDLTESGLATLTSRGLGLLKQELHRQNDDRQELGDSEEPVHVSVCIGGTHDTDCIVEK